MADPKPILALRHRATTVLKLNQQRIIYVLEASGHAGGVIVIFDHAILLSQHGWDVRFFSLAAKPDWIQLPMSITWEIFRTYDDLQAALLYEEDSLKVATWWRTAPVVKGGCKGEEGCYFVQDIETGYSVSLDYQNQVLSTYDLDLDMYTPSTYVKTVFDMGEKPCEYVGLWVHPKAVYNDKERYSTYPALVLSVLRQQWLKGFQTLAEYWRKMEQATNEVMLSTYGVNDAIPFGMRHQHHARVDDANLKTLFDRASVFVYASNQEGTGMPLIEAMLAGAPVVTTACFGNLQFCINEETCILVAPGDADALRDGSLRVIQDRAFARQIARTAHHKAAEMFKYDTVSKRVLDYYTRRWSDVMGLGEQVRRETT